MSGQRPQPSLRMVWGLAKSPELQLTSEELHLLVSAYTGKDSLRLLNKKELSLIVRELQRRKDSVRRQNGCGTAGSTATASQRKKITRLAEELGWKEEKRVNGLAQKMFGVARVEWLDYRQCSKLIEALKAMRKREEGHGGEEAHE